MCNVVCCSYAADILLTADRLLAADTLLTAEILHLTSVTVAEDALRCLVVRPGMAFQPDGHDSWFLCLANLRWCFLGWPFSAVGDDGQAWQLDPAGLLQPFFMHKMDQYQCTCVNPVMNPGSQTIQLELGDVELPLRCFSVSSVVIWCNTNWSSWQKSMAMQCPRQRPEWLFLSFWLLK